MSGKTDLPRRMWRQWWRHLPGYWRIGINAGLVIFLLHIALAIRMVIGWQEAAVITELRAHRNGISYQWEDGRYHYEFANTISRWFTVRSCRNVGSIRLRPNATNGDFELVGHHFPDLRKLDLLGADITRSRLESLRGCTHLQELQIKNSDFDDALMPCLTQFRELKSIKLSGTLITKDSLAVLKQFPKLKNADVSCTDITIAEVEEFRQRHNNRPAVSFAIPEKKFVISSIRWSDGERSAVFNGEIRFDMQKRAADGATFENCFTDQDSKLSRYQLSSWTSKAREFDDGDFRLILTLNKQVSAPVELRYEDGIPSTRRVEYQMSVTKAEAINN